MVYRVPFNKAIAFPQSTAWRGSARARYWREVFGRDSLERALSRKGRLHYGYRVSRKVWPCLPFRTAEGVTLDDVGPVPGAIRLVEVLIRPEYRLLSHEQVGMVQTNLWFAFPLRTYLPALPGPQYGRALERLLRAWPQGRKHIEADLRHPRDQGVWSWAYVWLEPDPTLRPELRAADWRTFDAWKVAASIVWTAYLHVLGGADPQDAIRRAHAAPVLAVGKAFLEEHRPSGRSRVLPEAFLPFRDWIGAGSLRLWLDLPPVPMAAEYGWLWGTELAEAWRSAHSVDGFRVLAAAVGYVDGFFDLGADDADRQLDGVYPVCEVVSPDGQSEEGWVIVGSLWEVFDPEEAAVFIKVKHRAKREGADEETSQALAKVLRAWPAGEKALVFSRDRFLSKESCYHNCLMFLLAVRTGNARAEVIDEAIEKARRGASFRELRRWVTQALASAEPARLARAAAG